MKNDNKGNPHWILLMATLMLMLFSTVPWSRLSGGFFKSFSLLSDIVPIESSMPGYMDERMDKSEDLKKGDTVGEDIKASVVDGVVMIEDYTEDGCGLSRLAQHLVSVKTDNRPVRIGFVGDSYIDGDIFVEYVREEMQAHYGGGGVGYVPMQSDLPLFRSSVMVNGKGWTSRKASDSGKNTLPTMLNGNWYLSSEGCTTTLRGSFSLPHASEWNTTTLLFLADNDAQLVASLGNGERKKYAVKGAKGLQHIQIDGSTDNASIAVSSGKVTMVGAYLDRKEGVAVDCMPMKGSSGYFLRSLDQKLCNSQNALRPYDMIVLEFGLNIANESQTDYHTYTRIMSKVVAHIRECYPEAELMIMGIGDRGMRQGQKVQSVSSLDDFVKAQRQVARMAHTLFWDTRLAMGGKGAAERWTKASPKMMSADYIHLTHEGGKHLASLFCKAMEKGISKSMTTRQNGSNDGKSKGMSNMSNSNASDSQDLESAESILKAAHRRQ